MIFSISYWNDSLKDRECAKLEIIIKDSTTYNFISQQDI